MKKIATPGLLLIFILLATKIFATNYYVSALTGNNSFSGTSIGQAFATIKKAADLTNPGDTVFIMNGTYNPIANFQQSIVTITRSGQPGAYITYKAYPGHTPKLQLQTGLNFQIWRAIAIDASYIIVTGIEIEGTNQQLDYAGAYQTYTDYKNNIKDWNKISMYNCGSISIGGGAAAHHVIVANCKIYDTGGGIGAFNSDYLTIENNLVYNTCWYSMYAGSGISILDPTSIDAVTTYKMFVRNNVVHNNKTLIPWERINALSDGNGIILDVNIGNGTTTFPYIGRYLVENNVSYNNGGGGVHAFKAAHVDIINNTAYNNGTVVGYPEIDANQCSDVKIYNNIMYARTGGNCNGNDANTIYDYNLYFNGPSYRTRANDLVGVNPRFVNPALDGTADLSLSNVSPAINSGSNTTGQYSLTDILGVARPVGAKPDRGAYEFTGTVGTLPGFSQGNIAVLRVGDGSTTLSSNAAPATILEYAPNGTQGPMTVVLSNDASTAPNRLLLTGDGTTNEGQLNLSSDGKYLTVAGYEAAVGATAATYKANEKVLARITFDGSAEYSTRIAAATMNGTVRSTVVNNTNRMYVTGSSTSPASGNSTRFLNFGTPTTTTSTAFFGGVRSLAVFSNQLYYVNNNTVGSLTPNPSAGNYGTSVAFPGVSISGHSYQALALLDIDPTASYAGTGYDVLYCADANLGLVKFYFNGTTWIFAGNFNPATSASGGMYAVTAWQNDAGNPQIYAVKGATANNEIVMLTDGSGFTGSISTTPPTVTVVTTAGANYMFRGVAFTPAQSAVLPLNITTFNAALVANNAHLAWATATEFNAKAFEVEHSTDGTNFNPIGQVSATNFSNGSSYTFIDNDLQQATNWYRLKAIDKDGSFKYSKVIALQKNYRPVTKLSLYPNPVVNAFTLAYTTASSKSTISIYTTDGRQAASYLIATRSTQQTVDVSALPAGRYTVVYTNGKEKTSIVFIK